MLCAVRRVSSSSGLAVHAVRSMSSATMDILTPYETHGVEGPDVTSTDVTKEDLDKFHTEMYTIRRMEITCDTEYKARNIRGFCHLYDGQEAVAVGMQVGLEKDDDVISTYRCHGLQYARGGSVQSIFAELFGKANGASKGKGGSMHLYSKANRFWGGTGIVGAQVPVGAGLAFANRYLAKAEGRAPNVAVAMYGDGAANQGQIWEAANMSKLWNVPTIFMCENNSYGMGTSVARHSSNPDYYKQGGDAIPGIKIDGMDVLAVREGMKWARNWVSSNSTPLFIEMKTYRYHGHSMSDPGLTYRDRTEVASVRDTRDCIELTRKRMIDAGWATAAEIKSKEKDIRGFIKTELDAAKAQPVPALESMYDDVWYKEVPKFIRGIDIESSLVSK